MSEFLKPEFRSSPLAEGLLVLALMAGLHNNNTVDSSRMQGEGGRGEEKERRQKEGEKEEKGDGGQRGEKQ